MFFPFMDELVFGNTLSNGVFQSCQCLIDHSGRDLISGCNESMADLSDLVIVALRHHDNWVIMWTDLQNALNNCVYMDSKTRP